MPYLHGIVPLVGKLLVKVEKSLSAKDIRVIRVNLYVGPAPCVLHLKDDVLIKVSIP